MKFLILCVLLLIASTHAFTVPNPAPVAVETPQESIADAQDHKVEKRFISALLYSLMDDDDYFDDDLPPVVGRRRPSRRHLQLAQMMRQLAGPQGMTRGQCVLLIASTHAFTIPNPALVAVATTQETTAEEQDHKVEKRFISALLYSMMDDDDYFDEADLPPVFGGRRRRPSRRTLQLAQMMRQLAGPRGLTREQMQNMQQNLQNLQLLQNMQQTMQMQNVQG